MLAMNQYKRIFGLSLVQRVEILSSITPILVPVRLVVTNTRLAFKMIGLGTHLGILILTIPTYGNVATVCQPLL